MRKGFGIILLLIAVFAGGNTLAIGASVNFSDGTFNDSDWAITVLGAGNGGTATASQVLSGGNPGSFRQITEIVNAAPNGSSESVVLAFNEKLGATFNPGTTGAISSIDYSEDAMSTGQGFAPAFIQGGTIYVYDLLGTAPSTWTSETEPGLTAGTFVSSSAFGVSGGPVTNPDFSTAGAPLTFGFVRTTASGNGGGGFATIGGIDNWSLTVNYNPSAVAVPLPSSVWGGSALIGGLCLAAAARRRFSF